MSCQCSQNVDVNGPHHRYSELIVSSSFNQPMAVERGRSHELVGSMVGAVYVHVLRTLCHAALAKLIFDKVELEENEKVYLSKGLQKVGEENVEEFLSDPIMKKIEEKFVAAIEKLGKNGLTSQLWLLNFKLICLVLRYIDAERSGNFDLHLEIVLLMIPIFFASGHHLYAKACLLYVQQMLKL